jgi:uncharacterized oligopeptide transporter (OPT) family protein
VTQQNGESWTKKKYRASKELFSWLEVGLGLYFVSTIAIGMFIGAWASVPFVLLFMVGFLYVGTLSVHQAR